MTDQGDRPEGQRFSHVYLAPRDLLPDSARLRHRLAHHFLQFPYGKFGDIVSQEIGVKPSGNGKHSWDWEAFFRDAALRDVLDLVTVRWRIMTPSDYMPTAQLEEWRDKQRKRWIEGVRRIFAEERVRYKVDDRGGVHFAVDTEFERLRATTISGLGSSRYANVAELYNGAFADLDASPPDLKHAIRGVFLAAEGLFGLMYATKVLGVDEINRHLRPDIEAMYAPGTPEHTASQKMLTSMREWIIAAHQYRHEAPSEEPAQPPLELAILMISQGSAFIRWLISLDRSRTSAGKA